MLNFIIATNKEWENAGYTPIAGALKFMIDTQEGQVEVILQHVQDVMQLDDYETFVRKMPVGNIVSQTTLEYLLPIETEV